MHVRVLETWSYRPDGLRRTPQTVTEPSWELIAKAIRQMDRQMQPILFLWASEDPAQHMIDEFSARLEVLGGVGAYWLAGTFSGYFQRRFLDPKAGDAEVEVYGSLVEEGFGSPARHICRDVEVVLRVAKYYAERGGFDPSVAWEE